MHICIEEGFSLRESRRQHRDLYASNSSQLSLRKQFAAFSEKAHAAFSEKAQRFSEKASVCGDLMGKLFLQWLIYKDSKYLTIYFFLKKRSEHLNSPPPRHC